MKIPAQLSKALTEAQKKELESNLKSSVLAKQLRKYLEDGIKAVEIAEEQIAAEPNAVLALLGQRRGYRQILNLLPES